MASVMLSGCWRPEEKETSRDYRQLGDSISLAAQQTLLRELSAALERGGPAYAVDLCSEHATQLTDSLASHYGCSVQRVALRNRNPANALMELDRNAYDEFARSLSAGETPTAMVVLNKDQAIYYKPIMLGMPMCLKCHGDEISLDPEAKGLLKTRYPKDKAIDFRLGELRGMWKVSFPIR